MKKLIEFIIIVAMFTFCALWQHERIQRELFQKLVEQYYNSEYEGNPYYNY